MAASIPGMTVPHVPVLRTDLKSYSATAAKHVCLTTAADKELQAQTQAANQSGMQPAAAAPTATIRAPVFAPAHVKPI